MGGETAAAETDIRARADAGDIDGAVTMAIEAYGDELFGFLVGLAGDHDRACDVFSAVCEKTWRNLPRFRWESSYRVWMYTIARNEFLNGVRRDRRNVPLSAAPSVVEAAARVQSRTPPHRRTDVKERFARVREGLDPDDHMLLGLRLEGELEWNEIARVLGSGDPGDLVKDAARLRKRFERLKEKLTAMAAELLGDGD